MPSSQAGVRAPRGGLARIVGIVAPLGVLGLFACAQDLDALEPFPCASDQSCPSGFSCVPTYGCTKSPLTKAPFPCLSTGKCPAGLACVDGSCTAAKQDTPCLDSSVQCSVGDASLSCASGLCAASCTSDSACGSGHRCDNGHCYRDCTTSNSCPSPLTCQDSYRGFKTCLGGSYVYNACKSVESTSCTASSSFTCPDLAVSCRNSSGSWSCPRGTLCGASYQACGACTTGSAVDCNGRSCTSSNCSNGYWVCKSAGPSKPGCSSTLTGFSGTCTCASGKTISFGCSTSSTCEALCKGEGTAVPPDNGKPPPPAGSSGDPFGAFAPPAGSYEREP